MNGKEHYAEADALISDLADYRPTRDQALAAAHVHATLALVDMLSDYDMDCREAGNGKKALEAIDGPDRIDAIVVDMGLPDMSGQRVIEAALARRPGTPVVRCSGTVAATADAPLLPGVHIFPKPYIASKLAEFLKSLIDAKA